MRTLVVVRSLKMGGMERVAVNLADAFAENGHDSHLLSFRKVKNPLAPENGNVKVHLFPLQWVNRLTVIGFLLESLVRWFINPFIRRSLFLGTGLTGGLLFRGWLRAFEKRHGRVDRIIFRGVGTFELVWTFRDDRARYVLENLIYKGKPEWRLRLFARRLYQGRHLVVVSGGVAENVREAEKALDFSPKSLSVIVNPCPVNSIRRQMEEPDPDIPETPYLVSVARLVPAKDHAFLLKAYALSGLEIPLVLVGDGQERERLESLAVELGIGERVIFTGQKSNPYPWMRHARLFVLSSRFEGMGIVLFEALACGTPVLSVDCPGGIREILKGDLESSVVPRTPEALAQGLKSGVEGDKPAIKDRWLADFLPHNVVNAFLDASA